MDFLPYRDRWVDVNLDEFVGQDDSTVGIWLLFAGRRTADLCR